MHTLPESVYARAWELARTAGAAEEVPVAALVFQTAENRIIGESRNRIVELRDPTAHAELLAVRAACAAVGSERLPSGCVLVSSLEPCVMCSGALILARVDEVHWFAPTQAALGLRDVLAGNPEGRKALNHRPGFTEVENYRERTADLLRTFFQERRAR